MAQTYHLRELYSRLTEDKWRTANPLSEDIMLVNRVLFNPYATNGQREEQMLNWMQRYQPCLFGRIAASSASLQVCILTDEDLQRRSDQSIADIIHGALLTWKRRSLYPVPGFSSPAHGFVLIAASPRLTNASPNEHLYAFSEKLRDLWGCSSTQEQSGTIHWETLYLRHPDDEIYVAFTFGVDFFAAQGDGRWWHDHRTPGGILFTANSVGHMQRYREWYLKMKEQNEWVLQTAMLTINEAADTPYGKATWLKPLLADGKPLIRNAICPFSKPERVKAELIDKDFTRYGGYLHTDHSIRGEFFHENPEPISDVTAQEYLQDFSYLFDRAARDHVRFVAGKTVSAEQVFSDLCGPIDSWTQIPRRRVARRRGVENKSQEQLSHERELASLLEKGSRWRLSEEEKAQY